MKKRRNHDAGFKARVALEAVKGEYYLTPIGAKQKGPAVRQLDMRHLQLRAFAAQNSKVLAPIELEGIAGSKRQRPENANSTRVVR